MRNRRVNLEARVSFASICAIVKELTSRDRPVRTVFTVCASQATPGVGDYCDYRHLYAELNAATTFGI